MSSDLLVREVELHKINALETTSSVRFELKCNDTEVLSTTEKPAQKSIIWETSYRVAVSSYQCRLELQLIRTSQDLLTNQLTEKQLGSCVLDWLTLPVLEKGEGSSDDCSLLLHTNPSKKTLVGKLSAGWSYHAAPNPYSDLDLVRDLLILPIYAEQLLLAPDPVVLRSILGMQVQDGVAGAMMRYYAYNMKALKLFELAVQSEIEATSTASLPDTFVR